jgi:hypothetical protein
MMLQFKLWLEGDEDYFWYNAGRAANGTVKDILQNPNCAPYVQEAKARAQRELSQNDAELLQGLKGDKLNILLNWLALHILIGGYKGETSMDLPSRQMGSMRLGAHKYAPKPVYITRAEWDQVKDVFHANVNNPNFWKALGKATPPTGMGLGTPAVSFRYLQQDAALFRTTAQNKDKNASRTEGPQGRVLIQFPDGWKWIALDKAYCDQEGNAGGHCGNILGQHRPEDRIVSLKNPQNQVEATYIINNHNLGEAKGYSNQKVNPELHPYVAALLLADGPDPLPIKNCFEIIGDYKPDLDTKAVDLIYSPNLDSRTKEAIKQKFDHEFQNQDALTKAMSAPISDQKRKEIIDLSNMDEAQKQHMISHTKEIGDLRRIAEVQLFELPDHEVINYQLNDDFKSITDRLSWNIDQLKLLVDNNWLRMKDYRNIKVESGYNFKEYIYTIIETVSRALEGYQYAKTNYSYFTKTHDPKPYGAESSIVLRDNPRRREIGKLMKRFGKLVYKLCEEVIAHYESVYDDPYDDDTSAGYMVKQTLEKAHDCLNVINGNTRSG